MTASIEHGGDPGGLEALYGRPAEGWLDLSTGINPDGHPIPQVTEEAWRSLPTAAQLATLESAARAFYAAPDGSAVVVASGSQALIQWLPRLRPASKVAVLGPTYGEHGPSWQLAGHDVAHVGTFEALTDADVAVLCNPNNPDGRAVAPADLLSLHGRLAAKGGWLIVDEAFVDVGPALSVVPAVGAPGLIVLRSLGKFFGLAGLRLGFALTDAALGGTLAAAIGPWAVSTPAAVIGAEALSDAAWISHARRYLPEQAARLDGLLAGAGLDLVGGTALFRLIRSPRAKAVFAHLARSGICVRRFGDRPDLLRFGLPGRAGWDRLERALAKTAAPACEGS